MKEDTCQLFAHLHEIHLPASVAYGKECALCRVPVKDAECVLQRVECVYLAQNKQLFPANLFSDTKVSAEVVERFVDRDGNAHVMLAISCTDFCTQFAENKNLTQTNFMCGLLCTFSKKQN